MGGVAKEYRIFAGSHTEHRWRCSKYWTWISHSSCTFHVASSKWTSILRIPRTLDVKKSIKGRKKRKKKKGKKKGCNTQ